MLKAEHRLRRSRDFTSTVRRGAAARRASVVVHVATGTTGEHVPTKVGFVVGRAVGGAVVRNTVRRRLRHLVAARLDELPGGMMIVVRALPGAAVVSRQSLVSDVDQAFAAATRRVRSR